jgi:hypothetical protein
MPNKTARALILSLNWLQVSASTKLPEIDEREGDQFEPKMMTRFGLKAQQPALDFILPGKSAFHTEAPFVERVSNEALAPPFGLLAVPWILFAVRPQASSDEAFALGLAVKAGSQLEPGTGHSEQSEESFDLATLRSGQVAPRDPSRSLS